MSPHKNKGVRGSKDRITDFVKWLFRIAVGWILVAWVMVAMFSYGSGRFRITLATAAAVSFAAGVIGGTVGFVLAVPRVLTSAGSVQYNSNLERISD